MSFKLPAPDIPGYHLIRLIRQGSQGEVYEAIQVSTRRRVALKLCSARSFSAASVRARFQREIQLLASIRHPNIVSVYDSGTVDGGFYFAMEYIAGHPLNEYLSEAGLDLVGRVRLFVKICDAIRAAHLHGVIHRDLKPGNILVNTDGEPHIVDFGPAKLAPGENDDEPWVWISQTGEFVGSLPWASPEQAEGDPARIDMRTDVYSLGVILYQMLTDRFPYPIAGGTREVLDRILNVEPAPIRAMFPEIEADLETIVLKALSKSPQRRYQSAGDLAADLRSFLAGDPIGARRDSTFYVLRKKLRRHRARVGVAAAFLVLAGASGIGLAVIRRQLAAAERRAVDIQLEFLDKALAAANPGNREEPDLAALQEVAGRIESELAAYPAIQARLMERVGNVFRRLGLLEAADPYLERSVQIQRTDARGSGAELASALHSLAGLRWDQGAYAEAEKSYRDAVQIRTDVFGGVHPLVAESMNELAAVLSSRGDFVAAEQSYRRALHLRVELLGEAHHETAATRNNLASCLMETGKYAEAEALYRRVLNEMARSSGLLTGAERPQYQARAMTSLGACLVELGRLDEAEPFLREALDLKKSILGPNHPSVALSLHWLGRLAYERKDWDAAEPITREVIAIREAALPDEHPHMATSFTLLGAVLEETGRHGEAEQLLTRALQIQREKLPPGSWRTAYTATCLAKLLLRQNRLAEAAPLIDESVRALRQARGDEDRYTQEALRCAVKFHQASGEHSTAREYSALLRME